MESYWAPEKLASGDAPYIQYTTLDIITLMLSRDFFIQVPVPPPPTTTPTLPLIALYWLLQAPGGWGMVNSPLIRLHGRPDHTYHEPGSVITA